MPSPVRLSLLSAKDRDAFLAAVARSTRLHRPWVSPPSTPEAFRKYLEKLDGTRAVGFRAMVGRDLVGVINVSEIVHGSFLSAYLGYYAFAPHSRHGYMSAALSGVVTRAFRQLRLHRLEANIQPGNSASIALVRRLGFRKEGFSERYLKIGGRWRDHERWAITKELWNPPRQ